MSFDLTKSGDYIKTSEVKNLFTLKLNKVNIVEIYMHPITFEIEKDHLVLLTNALGLLTEGKKYPVFIQASDFMGLSKEGGEYSASKESNIYTSASAVLVETLAAKILFNFYLQINKPTVPTKSFTTKEAAFEWLKNFK